MTKRKWREELKRRAINAHREREIEELDRRRLVGTKAIPAIGSDANVPPFRSMRCFQRVKDFDRPEKLN